MAREAHLEAAKHHLEAATKHLAAVSRYNEGDVFGAERNSEEAWVGSQVADGKSAEAHRQSTMAVKIKFCLRWNFRAGGRHGITVIKRIKTDRSSHDILCTAGCP